MRDFRLTELGEELRCCSCDEYWPADEEFFYRQGPGWHSYCKACYSAHPSIAKRRVQLPTSPASESARWLQAALYFVVREPCKEQHS